MPWLIDAYNVLHQTMPPALAGLGEAGLCDRLTRGIWAAQSCILVCDGKPKPHSPDPAALPHVRLVFTGPHRSADDWITDHARKLSDPRRWVVVTTDRALQQRVRPRRVRLLDSDAFLSALARGQLPPSAPDQTIEGRSARPTKHTPHTIGEQQTQRWLKAFRLDEAQRQAWDGQLRHPGSSDAGESPPS